jgi:hypothetical protein
MEPDKGTFEDDYEWQAQFLPEIKQLFATILIDAVPVEEDRMLNGGLIVLRLDPVRVACRVRRFHYLHRYRDQFTLRASRPSGVPTDIHKVLSGWGDNYFYGFAKQDDTGLAAWLLGSLNVFRLWHDQQLAQTEQPPGTLIPNDDGTTFRAYSIDQLPPEFIVSRVTAQPSPGHVA